MPVVAGDEHPLIAVKLIPGQPVHNGGGNQHRADRGHHADDKGGEHQVNAPVAHQAGQRRLRLGQPVALLQHALQECDGVEGQRHVDRGAARQPAQQNAAQVGQRHAVQQYAHDGGRAQGLV